MNLREWERTLDDADAEPSPAVEGLIYLGCVIVVAVALWLTGCCLKQEYSVSVEQRTRDGETVRMAWKGEVERR